MAQKTIGSKMFEVPREFVELAQRRTEFLFRHMTYGDMSMRNVLACAYAQGLADAGQALERGPQEE